MLQYKVVEKKTEKHTNKEKVRIKTFDINKKKQNKKITIEKLLKKKNISQKKDNRKIIIKKTLKINMKKTLKKKMLKKEKNYLKKKKKKEYMSVSLWQNKNVCIFVFVLQKKNKKMKLSKKLGKKQRNLEKN